MMAFIKRMLSSITPWLTRANGGTFVTFIPHGAGLASIAPTQLQAATGVGSTWAFGAVVTAISATANTTECWIEGIILSAATTAALQYQVAITTATAITAVGQVLAEVPGDLALTTSRNVIPLNQRIYVPAGKQIGMAIATATTAGKKASAQLIISRQK